MSAVPFAMALFSAAALLLAVQPVAGKVLLPLAGGSPAAWAACLVFFQAVLLLGYLYADRLGAIRVRWQPLVHLAVGAVGFAAALFIRPDAAWIPDDAEYPFLGILAFLAAFVGLPFFALSATAPLLQRWFASTGHRAAADPYFLYAASNAGSLLGLIAYPFLIEPTVPVSTQMKYGLIAYAVIFGLIAFCGVFVRSTPATEESAEVSDTPVTLGRRAKWLALAALPSAFLTTGTTHLTTDIAPVPLLWVVPLGLYLLSFVFAFARWPLAARKILGRVAPMMLILLAIALYSEATEPLILMAGVNLAALFAVALLCHGELAADRPDRRHLTGFYLTLSAGGVLGGLACAVVAPMLFANLGLVEYPLLVVLAALVRCPADPDASSWELPKRDLGILLAFAATTSILGLVVEPAVETKDPLDRMIRLGLTGGLPAAAAFALVRNRVRFAGCLAILLLASGLHPTAHGTTLLVARNFFGTLHVARSKDGKYVRLVHGTTQHGQQRLDEPGPPRPLMYYYRTGPIGRLFTELPESRTQRVGVVGLGCGALAAYAKPGETWTFFEIDPGVVRIARDSGHFTFLKECRGDARIAVGDARKVLAKEPDGSFDFLVLDAFSSDAIPAHLLTREAFEMYAKKLSPNGVLAVHLSNRYLDLPPIVARTAASLDPPFATKLDRDGVDSESAAAADGKYPSDWAILYRDAADLGPAAKDLHFQPVPSTPGPIWTDDFSNLLGAWRRDN